jgi:hypothetical protein
MHLMGELKTLDKLVYGNHLDSSIWIGSSLIFNLSECHVNLNKYQQLLLRVTFQLCQCFPWDRLTEERKF